jgi:hypothetical protein
MTEDVQWSEADLMEQAFNLICNAFPFDADRHTPGWHESAAQWRDGYHMWLDAHLSKTETIETVIQLDRYVWDWVDIGGTGVQVRLDQGDVPNTFRFRPKPGCM